MLHSRNVVRLRQRTALCIGDRYHRDIVEGFVDVLQLGQIKPAMQRGHERHTGPSQDRVSEIVHMKMDDVEFLGPPRHHFQHHDVRREIIPHP